MSENHPRPTRGPFCECGGTMMPGEEICEGCADAIASFRGES